MRSRNWRRKSVLACVAISLLACGGAAAQSPQGAQAKTPALVLLDGNDAAQWQTWMQGLGWRVLVPSTKADTNIDTRVLDLEAVVRGAIEDSGVDPGRVYLAGRGDAAAAVFYAISRAPDVWAAGVALGGAPQKALDSNRIFAANFANTPVLWAGNGADDEALAKKLEGAGLNMEYRAAAGLTTGAVFDWLARHSREEFPDSVDCETNSPQFASCFWVHMTKFDAGERNDVLPVSLIPGGSGAYLDLGGFGYKASDPGPGVLISMLPPKYNGPLKMGDRIVELDGKPIADGRQFAETMAQTDQEKTAVAMVQRGKARIRVETRVVVPRRDPLVTARVQAKYIADEKTIQIISRTATEMRVTIPPQWVPGNLFWNGLSLEDLKKPGCYLLRIEKELLHASPCAN